MSGLSSPAKSESGENTGEAVLCPGGAAWGCEPLGDVDTGLWMPPVLINASTKTRGCIPQLFQSHVRLNPAK